MQQAPEQRVEGARFIVQQTGDTLAEVRVGAERGACLIDRLWTQTDFELYPRATSQLSPDEQLGWWRGVAVAFTGFSPLPAATVLGG